jgi:hypothetical protein
MTRPSNPPVRCTSSFCGHHNWQLLAVIIGSFTEFFRSSRAFDNRRSASMVEINSLALAIDLLRATANAPRRHGFREDRDVFNGAKT